VALSSFFWHNWFVGAAAAMWGHFCRGFGLPKLGLFCLQHSTCSTLLSSVKGVTLECQCVKYIWLQGCQLVDEHKRACYLFDYSIIALYIMGGECAVFQNLKFIFFFYWRVTLISYNFHNMAALKPDKSPYYDPYFPYNDFVRFSSLFV